MRGNPLLKYVEKGFLQGMNKLNSIRIIHDILHRTDFFYLAELFRFMGVFVCEKILVEPIQTETEAERNTMYDAYIYIGKLHLTEEESDKLSLSQEEYNTRIDALPENTLFLYDVVEIKKLSEEPISCQTVEIQKKALADFWEKLLDKVYEAKHTEEHAEKITPDGLAGITDTFVDEQLWLHSMNMQYYQKKASWIIECAEDAFLKTQKRVAEFLQDKQDKPERYLYEYANLWSQVQMNIACKYNNRVLYFSIAKLEERCKKLCNDFPEFTNAVILLGLCYEPSLSHANEAVAAFADALDRIGTECFASAVYYWIGKRYEAFRDRKNEEEECYKCANRRKYKFRNTYKLAICARNRGDHEEALRLLDDIIEKLNQKRKMFFLDPLELEYLFKTCFQATYICFIEEDYNRAIKYGRKGEEIWTNDIKENKFFDAFYGNEAENYKEEWKKRLNVIKVYCLLMDSYNRMHETEEAETYYRRMKMVEMEREPEQKIVIS